MGFPFQIFYDILYDIFVNKRFFRSSTFHLIIHDGLVCYTLVIFIRLEAHYFNVLDSSYQNNNAACKVSYNAFLSFTCSRGLSCLFFHLYFQFNFASSLTISLAIKPSNSIWKSCSMSVCSNGPGISVTAGYLPSFESIPQDNRIASSDTVGELVSNFVVYSLCDLLSAQPFALYLHHVFLLGKLNTIVLHLLV